MRKSRLQILLGSIMERGSFLSERQSNAVMTAQGLNALCQELLGVKGQASAVALADLAFAAYERLPSPERGKFFRHLAHEYDPDPDAVIAAAKAFAKDRTSETATRLSAAAEPPRQELLRRLNFASDGTHRIVRMRDDLARAAKDVPELRRIDEDFQHLLKSWFNRGFLILKPIDWTTPAHILEKIIAYEAVHEIDGWEDLRRRLAPRDRRCFGFFHPAMPSEPLVFVEVALTADWPDDIHAVLREDRRIIDPENAKTAVFYSISNCQPGLRGVSFGAFLIKQVMQDLARDLPNLETFVTLSPVPGLTNWLSDMAKADATHAAAAVLPHLDPPAALRKKLTADAEPNGLKRDLLALAAEYLLHAKRPQDGQPVDPVARFHLGNGASLAGINWMADLSPRGLRQSAGIMVNYRYDFDKVEVFHERYINEGLIETTAAIRSLLPKRRKTGVKT